MAKKTEIQSRTIRILEWDGTQITGQVNIRKEPGYDRLSDLLNNDDKFLTIIQATVYPKELDNPVKHEVMFVNKNDIKRATPDPEQK